MIKKPKNFTSTFFMKKIFDDLNKKNNNEQYLPNCKPPNFYPQIQRFIKLKRKIVLSAFSRLKEKKKDIKPTNKSFFYFALILFYLNRTAARNRLVQNKISFCIFLCFHFLFLSGNFYFSFCPVGRNIRFQCERFIVFVLVKR